MPNESTARDYQSIPDMTQVYRASWKTFYVILSGITNNTHVEFVKMIKSHGHTEVTDPEECDYCLLFCPITSRVGTDVELALRKIPANKPTILVVMYHTFDRYHVVLDSRRLTEDPRVHLTVNSLFHEHNLLNSNCNETAKYEIRKFLELSQNLLSIIRRNPLSITKCAKWALVSLPCFLIFYGAYTRRYKWLGYLGIWPRRNVCNYFRVSPGFNILATTNICSSSV
ncbi:uncharacterized protein LOC133973069 isoform X2 [Platichthys flesus]|uniref:uncharacterized protein LOC133973069 isoform X2 n=1 Tax=Platichthys flesus TaxID=8260 RepID=UPI002DBFD7A9|nr:uncharacterized protein LOC133973069 isoform X2 [Platichthys flesus]